MWELVADEMPEAQALVHGDTRRTWAEFDRRADGLARTLLDAGVERQDKVAQYLYNCHEYLESVFGAIKIGLVPVNTNYRYVDNELVYLWDNADAVAVVFHGVFAERIEGLRHRVPRVRTWLWVDDGSGPCPEWAIPYEAAATSADHRVAAPWGRTGGTGRERPPRRPESRAERGPGPGRPRGYGRPRPVPGERFGPFRADSRRSGRRIITRATNFVRSSRGSSPGPRGSPGWTGRRRPSP